MFSFYPSNRRRSLQNRSFAFSPPILALFLLGTYCFGQAGKTELFVFRVLLPLPKTNPSTTSATN